MAVGMCKIYVRKYNCFIMEFQIALRYARNILCKNKRFVYTHLFLEINNYQNKQFDLFRFACIANLNYMHEAQTLI